MVSGATSESQADVVVLELGAAATETVESEALSFLELLVAMAAGEL